MKQELALPEVSSPVTSVAMSQIEDRGIDAPKDLSLIVPGLFIPDYGSAMTSSVYMRGLGSRLDNPVIGLYIDDVPVLDKNNYDFQLLDVRRVDVFRGPREVVWKELDAESSRWRPYPVITRARGASNMVSARR